MTLAASLTLASCGAASAADAQDPISCGVALIIESYNARTYGSPDLADDLAPIIKWYTVKGAQLPPHQRTPDQGLALMKRFRSDVASRKKLAKGCVREAMTDPLYQEVLPELANLPDPTRR